MKFVVDAQLPLRLAEFLREEAHDAIHTLELPQKNLTTDARIIRLSMQQRRVVITKDHDFLDTFLLHRQPYKLLLVTTGNIRNSQLMQIFSDHLRAVTDALKTSHVVELTRDSITIHH